MNGLVIYRLLSFSLASQLVLPTHAEEVAVHNEAEEVEEEEVTIRIIEEREVCKILLLGVNAHIIINYRQR